jgi:hypothetical protein
LCLPVARHKVAFGRQLPVLRRQDLQRARPSRNRRKQRLTP